MATMLKISAHKRGMPKRKLPPMEGFSEPEEDSGDMVKLPEGMEPLKPGEKREVVMEIEGSDGGMAKITKMNGIPMSGEAEASNDHDEDDSGEPPKDESFMGAAMGPEQEAT